MSRSNDVVITVHPGPGRQADDRVDQVRNGNRWRVLALDTDTHRLAAERLSDSARVVFGGDYLKNHVTLGYAATVHSAQGVTADSCYAILGEGASRAMLYVAMTRGRHNNEAFLYQRFTDEADHEQLKPVSDDFFHIARRGNKYSAAHCFRVLLSNDDRPRTMHDEAERTERRFLPEKFAEVLRCQEHRRRNRQTTYRAYLESTKALQNGLERMTRAASCHKGFEIDAGGVEL